MGDNYSCPPLPPFPLTFTPHLRVWVWIALSWCKMSLSAPSRTQPLKSDLWGTVITPAVRIFDWLLVACNVIQMLLARLCLPVSSFFVWANTASNSGSMRGMLRQGSERPDTSWKKFRSCKSLRQHFFPYSFQCLELTAITKLIRNGATVTTFKSALKTHFFSLYHSD